jgi:hypothetical protein
MRDHLKGNLARAVIYKGGRMVERAARRLGITPISLDPDRLEAATRRKARLDDFGDPYYREGLNRLVDSLEQDAELNLLGRFALRQMIVRALINRLLLQQDRGAKPEVYNAPLKPPLIITGLPRSGTTFLHRLLATQPDFFAPPYWMLVRPLPSKPGESDEVRRLTAKRDLGLWKAITPSLGAKHKVSSRLPEEDIFALTLTFMTVHWGMLVPADGYLAWCVAADRTKKYLDYRAILLAFQAQRPGKTLLLKAPDHLGGLEALAAAVPEATIVQLHRDPVAVVNSLSSLMYTVQMGFTERRDPARLAASLAGGLETDLRRNLEQRTHLTRPVIDVHYDRLTADPLGSAAAILDAFGRPPTARDRNRIERFLAQNPRDRRGRHEYRGADFGLDDAETAARFRFYSDAFGLDRASANILQGHLS